MDTSQYQRTITYNLLDRLVVPITNAWIYQHLYFLVTLVPVYLTT